MRIGKYFKVNPESIFNKGIVSFKHFKIRDKYPISLVITKNSIDFYYHNIDQIEEGHDDNAEKAVRSMRHINTCIIHLPLSGNLAVKDNLTSKLINYYKEKWDRINLRDIILDFLFDLEHNKVFRNSPYYEEAELKLKENFLFNVIADKTRYYYNQKKLEYYWKNKEYKRVQYRDIYSDNNNWNNKRRNITSEEEILLRNLWESEKEWLEDIYNKDYTLLSQRCEGLWVEKNAEEELKQIYDFNNRYDCYLKNLGSLFYDEKSK